MDNVLKVRRSFLNELRAFCNRFSSFCEGCYRRPCSCSLVDEIHMAKNLIVMIDNLRDADEEKFYIEHPVEELYDQILKAMKQANGRLVRSNEIKIPGISKQRKYQAIKKLLKRGKLKLIMVGSDKFYSVSDENNNKQNNKQ